MPFRFMERIWPFGRMLAVPPPRSETCLPGRGRFTALARVGVWDGPPTGPRVGLVRAVPGPMVLLPGPVLPTVPVPGLPVFVPGLVFVLVVRLPGPIVRFIFGLGAWVVA